MVQCLLNIHEALGLTPALFKLVTVAYTSNLSIWDMNAEGSGLQPLANFRWPEIYKTLGGKKKLGEIVYLGSQTYQLSVSTRTQF